LRQTGIVGDVTGLRERSPAQRLDLGRSSSHLRSPAACGNYICPGLRQCPGKGKPNATGSANHNCGLVGKIKKRVAHQKFCTSHFYSGMNYKVRDGFKG
jgi:hypothetical protein